MMRTSFALLLAATGCNWAFGLDATKSLEENPPDAARGPVSSLTWAIATGTPPTALTYAAIGSDPFAADKPMIRIGRALSAGGLLEPVEYPGELDGVVGGFELPYALRTSAHRIEYQLPGNPLPREIQWAITGAQLTAPRTTRLDAPMPPANGGYTIKPAGLSAQPQFVRMYTSGSLAVVNTLFWTFTEGGLRMTTEKWSTNALPLIPGSRLGEPQPAPGDWQLFLEIKPSGLRLVCGGWAKTAIAMTTTGPAGPSNGEPTWNATTHTMMTSGGSDPYPSVDYAAVTVRLRDVIGESGAKIVSNLGTTYNSAALYGLSPSVKLPGLVELPYENYTPRGFPSPIAIGLMYVQNEVPTSVTTADPKDAVALPQVVHQEIHGSRTVAPGVILSSGVSTITDNMSAAMSFPAPFATQIKLGDTSLWGATDAVAHPVSSSPTVLTWSRESSRNADDYIVTLYEIANSTLLPVREYQVLTESVEIDSTVLGTNRTYVFRIDARVGFPNAASGDYREAAFPFSITTTYSRTFKITP